MTHDDDDDKRRSEEEKRCFDLFATMLLAFEDEYDEEEQDRNLIMIHAAATNTTFSLGKRNRESKNQENTLVVESKRKRRVVVESDDDEPIREIKPPDREINQPVKRKEPVWVIELMKRFKGEGEDAKMIFEKAMTKTDVTPNHGRLLMPFKQMAEMDFLTKAELKILEVHHKHKRGGRRVKKGVDVILLNRSGEKRWNLNMRVWKMKNTFNYALCTGWNQVVFDNNLQINQLITLWSFHARDGTLYFAFDPPTPAPDHVVHQAPTAQLHSQDHHQDEAMVPATSSMGTVVISEEDPFVCKEANRRLSPFPKRSRTPRVCVQIIKHRSPQPVECTEMAPDLEGCSRDAY